MISLAVVLDRIGLGPKATGTVEKGEFAVQRWDRDSCRWRVDRRRYGTRKEAELAAFDARCLGVAARVRQVLEVST